LAEPPYLETVDWSRWHVFWVDERVVPKSHADSNYKLASDDFLSKVIACSVKFRICFDGERWNIGVSIDLLPCRLFLVENKNVKFLGRLFTALPALLDLITEVLMFSERRSYDPALLKKLEYYWGYQFY
jgi:hypothetical protein